MSIGVPIQVMVQLPEGKTRPIPIKNNSAVEEFMRIVDKQCLHGVGIDNFYLVYAGTELELGKKVSDYHVPNMAGIAICIRQKGGPGLTALTGYISLTSEPCCMTYEDDPGESRAKMTCGCAISVDAMCNFFKTGIEKGFAKFKCPNCEKDWQYFCIRHVLSAKYGNEELQAFDMKLQEIHMIKKPGVQQCPSCHFNCERTAINNDRVVCVICTKKNGKTTEFCWKCLNPWKNDLIGGCGNKECGSVESKLEILRTCQTKTIGEVPGVPSVRACDKCGTLINHKAACKHMKCRCGNEFCFVCLGKLDEKTKQWPCGFFSTPCQVAARQTTVVQCPGDRIVQTWGGESRFDMIDMNFELEFLRQHDENRREWRADLYGDLYGGRRNENVPDRTRRVTLDHDDVRPRLRDFTADNYRPRIIGPRRLQRAEGRNRLVQVDAPSNPAVETPIAGNTGLPDVG